MEPTSEIEEVSGDVARMRVAFVNLYFVGRPREEGRERATTPWVLVDTGLPMATARILEIAARRFGRDARPAAIVLTHGHFDHVGALAPLLSVWDSPVYAHPLEHPFLTGRADYPPYDPLVARGAVTQLAPPGPERGIDLGNRIIRALPFNGTIPNMPDWRWVHTPGHSPGHVSLFRSTDSLLIAGDAVATTRQESVFSHLAQHPELAGPPAPSTIDWDEARRSVSTLAALRPETVAAGHGSPLSGPTVADELLEMARTFDARVRPRRGRYVRQPAVTGEAAVESQPPAERSGGVRWGMLSGVAAAGFASTWLIRRFGKRLRTR